MGKADFPRIIELPHHTNRGKTVNLLLRQLALTAILPLGQKPAIQVFAISLYVIRRNKEVTMFLKILLRFSIVSFPYVGISVFPRHPDSI